MVEDSDVFLFPLHTHTYIYIYDEVHLMMSFVLICIN